MTKELTVPNQNKYLTAQEIQANARLIQEVMKAVMKDKIHYGTVPGCGDKPTLLKPGAEKILSTFRIAAFPDVIDLSSGDEKRFRILTKGIYYGNGSGVELGIGVGECSSDEEKYKWRKAVGKEYDETPEDRKRKKWKKGGYGKPDYQEIQVRTNPADLANTILKMAKKRSIVDLTLTVTAASDCFNQDIEDLPAEYVDQDEANPKQEPIKMPEAKTAASSETPPQAPRSEEKHPLPSGFTLIKAKFNGLCKSKACGQEVKEGSEIAYNKDKGVFHVACAG